MRNNDIISVTLASKLFTTTLLPHLITCDLDPIVTTLVVKGNWLPCQHKAVARDNLLHMEVSRGVWRTGCHGDRTSVTWQLCGAAGNAIVESCMSTQNHFNFTSSTELFIFLFLQILVQLWIRLTFYYYED